jgi:uncharacterized membrane protein
MRKWIPLIAVLAGFAFSAVVYSRLPDQMPVHWNWAGEVDGWAGRTQGAFMMPALALAVWALMRFLPRIDPRRANYVKFGDTYELIVAAIVVMLVLIHIAVLGAALGWPISIGRVVPALIGALLLLLGNVLPRARPNWWFGIRTPWTLSNDRVWDRTHRVGGYMLAGAGCLMLLSAAVPSPWTVALAFAGAMVAGLGSVVYSYIVWRQEVSRA